MIRAGHSGGCNLSAVMSFLLGGWLVAVQGAVLQVPSGSYSTISDALAAASSGDTIVVAPGVYSEFISLGNFNKQVYVVSEDGSDATVIDGGGTSRLMFIDNTAVAPTGHPIFDGFTWRNGRATTDNGNGSPISINNSSASFFNCVFEENHSSFKGGAVLVFDGRPDSHSTRVAFKNCRFENNQTDRNGGAVLGNGGNPFLVFDQCAFVGNTTRTINGANSNQGGALYFNDAESYVSRCSFFTNSANFTSGAIGNLHNTWSGTERSLTVVDSQFVGNFVQQDLSRPNPIGPTEGGAIFVENFVTSLIQRCVFDDHRADAGSCLGSYRAHLTVEDCVIQNASPVELKEENLFWHGGGGIAMRNDDNGGEDRREAVLTVQNSAILSCSNHVGGGIFAGGDDANGKAGSVVIEGSVVHGNETFEIFNSGAGAFWSGHGAGLYMGLVNVDFSDGLIIGNHSEGHGGAVVSVNGASVQVQDSAVAGNVADFFDDVFHQSGGTVTATGTTIGYNDTSDGHATPSAVDFLAAPFWNLFGQGWLAYFAAPYSATMSITPDVGALPNLGGYTVGVAVVPAQDSATVYTLNAPASDPTDTLFVWDPRLPPLGDVGEVPFVRPAEAYNEGGQNIGFHDLSGSVNQSSNGGADGSPYINFIQAGEYLEYAVDVADTATYELGVLVASAGTGGTLFFELDGERLGDPFEIPDTGGWDTWQWVTQTGLTVQAGSGQLRVAMRSNAGGFVGNFDAFKLSVPTGALHVEETVYAGHDSGASVPGSNILTGAPGNDITWVISVSNAWDGVLTGLTVNDPEVGLVDLALGDFAPGDATNIVVETVLTGSVTNTATVDAGTPGSEVLQVEDSATVISTDSDNDGLLDAWEIFWFEDLETSDGQTFSDSDVHSDLQEFLAGTNPKDGDDVLDLDAVILSGEDRILHWESRSNVVYAVYATDDLGVDFSVLESGIVATPPTNVWMDASAPGFGMRVYQIRVD